MHSIALGECTGTETVLREISILQFSSLALQPHKATLKRQQH